MYHTLVDTLQYWHVQRQPWLERDTVIVHDTVQVITDASRTSFETSYDDDAVETSENEPVVFACCWAAQQK